MSSHCCEHPFIHQAIPTSPHTACCRHVGTDQTGPSRLAEVLDTLVNRIHRLGIHCRSASGFAEDQLRLQVPGGGHVVRGLKLEVDGRVVVLEIAAETFGFESSPKHVLIHTARVHGPCEDSLSTVATLRRIGLARRERVEVRW